MDEQTFEERMAQLAAMPHRIEELACSLPTERWQTPAHAGEDAWTRRQLLAHIACNDLRQLTRIRIGAGIPQPGDYEDFYAQSVVEEWNQSQVQQRSGASVDALLDEMHGNRRSLVALLRSLASEQRQRTRINRRGQLSDLSGWFDLMFDHDNSHLREIGQ